MNVKSSSVKVGALVAAAGAFVANAQAALVWEAEAPFATSTSKYECVLVETFDSGSPSGLIGTYSGAFISGSDQYGGVGGSDYLDLDRVNESVLVTLELNQVESYFGMWWSAESPGNTVTFKKDDGVVGTFGTSDIFPLADSDYFGNPEDGDSNNGEQYAFINFSGMEFDEIVFEQTEGGGFESDNHTVMRPCGVPDGGSLFGVFSAAIASLFWARRKALRA